MSKYILNNIEKAYLKKLIINTRINYINKLKRRENEILTDFQEQKWIDKKIEENIFYLEREIYSLSNFIEAFSDERLIKAYEELSEKEQYILFAYYYLGMLDKEIGNQLHTSSKYLKKLRNKILNKIRRNLGGR